ncbi:hypothetical protein [Spirosoma arcticum]
MKTKYHRTEVCNDQYDLYLEIEVDEEKRILHPDSEEYTLTSSLIDKKDGDNIFRFLEEQVDHSALEKTITKHIEVAKNYIEQYSDPEGTWTAQTLKGLGFEPVPEDRSDF